MVQLALIFDCWAPDRNQERKFQTSTASKEARRHLLGNTHQLSIPGPSAKRQRESCGRLPRSDKVNRAAIGSNTPPGKRRQSLVRSAICKSFSKWPLDQIIQRNSSLETARFPAVAFTCGHSAPSNLPVIRWTQCFPRRPMDSQPKFQSVKSSRSRLFTECGGACTGCRNVSLRGLLTHHIDGDSSNKHFGNLLMLCEACREEYRSGVRSEADAMMLKQLAELGMLDPIRTAANSLFGPREEGVDESAGCRNREGVNAAPEPPRAKIGGNKSTPDEPDQLPSSEKPSGRCTTQGNSPNSRDTPNTRPTETGLANPFDDSHATGALWRYFWPKALITRKRIFQLASAIIVLAFWLSYYKTQLLIVNQSSQQVFLRTADWDSRRPVDEWITINPGDRTRVKREFAWNVPSGIAAFINPSDAVLEFVRKAPDSNWQHEIVNNGRSRVFSNFKVEGTILGQKMNLRDFKFNKNSRSDEVATIKFAMGTSSFHFRSVLPYDAEVQPLSGSGDANWHLVKPGGNLTFGTEEQYPFENGMAFWDYRVRLPDQELLQELHSQGKSAHGSQIARSVFANTTGFRTEGEAAVIRLEIKTITPQGSHFEITLRDANTNYSGSLEEQLEQARHQALELRREATFHIVNLTPFALKALYISQINGREARWKTINLAPASYRRVTEKFLAVNPNFAAFSISDSSDLDLFQLLVKGSDSRYVASGRAEKFEMRLYDHLETVMNMPFKSEEVRTGVISNDFIRLVRDLSLNLNKNPDESFTAIFGCEDMPDLRDLKSANIDELPLHVLDGYLQSAKRLRRALELRRKYRTGWGKYHHVPLLFPGTFSAKNRDDTVGLTIESVMPIACGIPTQLQAGDILYEVEGETIYGEEELTYIINQRGFQRGRGVKHPLSVKVIRNKQAIGCKMHWAYNRSHWEHTYGTKNKLVGLDATTTFGFWNSLTFTAGDEIIREVESIIDSRMAADHRNFWNLHFVEANRQFYPEKMANAEALPLFVPVSRLPLTRLPLPSGFRRLLDKPAGSVFLIALENGIWLKASNQSYDPETLVALDALGSTIPLSAESIFLGKSFKSTKQ